MSNEHGCSELLQTFDRFVDGIWRSFFSKSTTERLDGVELCRRVYAAKQHPEYEAGIDLVLGRYQWGETILCGPYFWFLDMNRSRQMVMALDEFDRHTNPLPYPPEVRVEPVDAALRRLRRFHAAYRRQNLTKSAGAVVSSVEGWGTADLVEAEDLLRRTYRLFDDDVCGLGNPDLWLEVPWRGVLEADPVEFGDAAHVAQLTEAVTTAEAEVAQLRQAGTSVPGPTARER